MLGLFKNVVSFLKLDARVRSSHKWRTQIAAVLFILAIVAGGGAIAQDAVPASTLYVSVDGNDTNDGSTPEFAFRNIQAAVDAATIDGTLILVGPGRYYSPFGIATNCVLRINKNVIVKSTAGRDSTFIDGDVYVDGKIVSTKYDMTTCVMSAPNAVLDGFSLVNSRVSGKAKNFGLRIGAGVATNCAVSIKTSWESYTLYMTGNSKAYNILILPSTAYASGGEIASVVQCSGSALLDGLILTNYTFGTTGATYGMIRIADKAVIRNALVADNVYGGLYSSSQGAVILAQNGIPSLENCTVVNNRNIGNKPAINSNVSTLTITNSIVCNNVCVMGETPNILTSKIAVGGIHNTISPDLVDGVNGNMTGSPFFVDNDNGDYRLRPVSPAIDAGGIPSWLCGANVDAYGVSRLSGIAVDIGCLEYNGDSDEDFSVAFSPSATTGCLTLDTVFSAVASGNTSGIVCAWDFGDGTISSEWPNTAKTYTSPGEYKVTLYATNSLGQTSSYTFTDRIIIYPQVCYVGHGGTATYPYDSWEKATPNLSDVIDVGPDRVIVTNGVYSIPAPCIMVFKPVVIESVNGPSETILKAPGSADAPCRFFDIVNDDVVISGFTLTNSYSNTYSFPCGVNMSAGTLTNCHFVGLQRLSRAMVCYLSGTARMIDCDLNCAGLICGNHDAYYISAIYALESALIERCNIHNFNLSSSANCKKAPVILDSANAVLRNCFIYGNTNGVVSTSSMFTSSAGVEIRKGTVENCTITGNSSGGQGAGLWVSGTSNCRCINSIVYGNTSLLEQGNDVYSPNNNSAITFTCASDCIVDSVNGNINSDPIFIGKGKFPFTPAKNSPCINSGFFLPWMDNAVDFAGNPRVRNRHPDMGAFEGALPSGSKIFIR